MRITLINPNTSRAAGPGVVIDAVCPETGAAAIESHARPRT